MTDPEPNLNRTVRLCTLEARALEPHARIPVHRSYDARRVIQAAYKRANPGDRIVKIDTPASCRGSVPPLRGCVTVVGGLS